MLKNDRVLKEMLHALYDTITIRTSKNFAFALLTIIKKAVEQRFNFFKYVKFNNVSDDEIVCISSEINAIDPDIIGRGLEAIIQVVFMDLKEKAGLDFISDLKKNSNKDILSGLNDFNMDLGLLELQQHYIFRQQKRIEHNSVPSDIKSHEKNIKANQLLRYSWDDVTNLEYDTNKGLCIIYDKNGNVIDKLDLDTMVKRYLSNLTEENK